MISTLSFVSPTVAMTTNGNIPVSDFPTKEFYESTAVTTANSPFSLAVVTAVGS